MKKTFGMLCTIILSTTLVFQAVMPSVKANELVAADNPIPVPLPSSIAPQPLYESEMEPNNTLEDNQRYSLTGGESFVFRGSVDGESPVEPNDTYDFFPFQAERSGYISAILQETSTYGLLSLDIVDEAENELDDDYENAVSEQHNIYLEQGRQYFARVVARNGMMGSGFSYRLKVAFSENPMDAYEPNFTDKEATEIQMGSSTEGTLHTATDTDWYKFYTSGVDQTFNISLGSLPEGTDYHIKVFDSSLNEIRSTESLGGNKELYDIFGAKWSTYYVQVYSLGGVYEADSYQLDLSIATEMDSFEPNNSSVQATSMAGKSGIKGTLHEQADQDWYSFKPTFYTQYVNVNLSSLPEGTDYQVKLYDDQLKLLATSITTGAHSRQIGRAQVAKDQTYYLQVVSLSGSHKSDTYEIAVVPLAYLDQQEPNDTKETAAAFTNSYTTGSVTGSIHELGDVDWYRMEAAFTGYFKTELFKPSGVDYHVELYDANMNKLGFTAASDPSTAATKELNKVFGVKGQPFYFKVYSTVGSKQQDFYTIRVTHEVPVRTDDEVEYNASFEAANPFVLGRAMQGHISTNNDLDTFKVVINGNGVANFALENVPSGKNYGITLYKGSPQNLVTYSNSAADASEYILNVPVKHKDVFYVRVWPDKSAYSDASNPYRLMVFTDTVPVDAYEHNDTRETATEASGAATPFLGSIHSATDEDFYRVTNRGLPYELQVTLSHIPAGANYDVMVVDEQGNIIESSHREGNENEELSVIVPKNKTYYVRVFPYTSDSYDPNQNYTLSLQNKGVLPILIVPGFGGTVMNFHDKRDGEKGVAWMNWGVTDTALTLALDHPWINRDFEVWYEDRDFGLWDISDIAPTTDMFGNDKYFDVMIEELKKQGYEPGKTLFGVPYNFIRDNTESAEILKRKIDLAVANSGANKVMLVSHSNGGLIVKETIMDPTYEEKVGKWVTLGTPWLGAPVALKAWIDGYDLDIPILDNKAGRELAIASPTAMGLIPSPGYLHTNQSNYPVLSYLQKNGSSHSKVDIRTYDQMKHFLSNVLKGQFNPYIDFREDLMENALRDHQRMYDLPVTDVPLYIISGEEMPTVGSYFYNHPVNDISELAVDTIIPFVDHVIPYYVSGDGTVPVNSSRGKGVFRIGTNNTKIYSVTGVKHMPLVRSSKNIDQVKQILIYGNEQPVADLKLVSHYNTTGLAAVSSDVNGLTDSETTVGVTATVISIPFTGEEATLSVTEASGDATIIRMLSNQTYVVEKQSNLVTVNKLGSKLWITVPVDQVTRISWTGSSLEEIRVYDLQNSEYKTSTSVEVSGESEVSVMNSEVLIDQMEDMHQEEMSGIGTESN